MTEAVTDYNDYIGSEKIIAKRAYAALCDYACYFLICKIYSFPFSHVNPHGVSIMPFFPHIPILIGLWFLYFPVVESINGMTVFKRVFKLKVVAEYGSKVSLIYTTVRHCLDPIDLFFLFGAVGVTSAKVSRLHQRLGDMVAGTQVISTIPTERIDLNEPPTYSE